MVTAPWHAKQGRNMRAHLVIVASDHRKRATLSSRGYMTVTCRLHDGYMTVT